RVLCEPAPSPPRAARLGQAYGVVALMAQRPGSDHHRIGMVPEQVEHLPVRVAGEPSRVAVLLDGAVEAGHEVEAHGWAVRLVRDAKLVLVEVLAVGEDPSHAAIMPARVGEGPRCMLIRQRGRSLEVWAPGHGADSRTRTRRGTFRAYRSDRLGRSPFQPASGRRASQE